MITKCSNLSRRVDTMEYVTFGRTGRTVSRLGFGGATAGLKNYLHEYDPGKAADREPVIAAIRRALELGVTYFDTAAAYGDGASERLFGEALDGVAPESIFLATKVGAWGDVDVRESLEGSLKRLRRERVDLLQVHGTNITAEQQERVLRPGGMLDQMSKLKDEGMVSFIGFTAEAINPALHSFIESGAFDTIQMCYNFLFQHPYDPGWQSGCLYDAESQGMGIAVMRSTTSGIFQRWIQTVNPSNTFNYTPALIQYQLSCPLVDVVLVGMRSITRVEENVRLIEDTTGRIDLEELHRRYVE
ncbi:MAG: hypothetical protein GF331_13200 [Chitinivibrionales bacterium]|nr:hypothetical protein [Chitinivibrionales bacterium]